MNYKGDQEPNERDETASLIDLLLLSDFANENLPSTTIVRIAKNIRSRVQLFVVFDWNFINCIRQYSIPAVMIEMLQ